MLTFNISGIASCRQTGVESKHKRITGTCAVSVKVRATADLLRCLLVAFKLCFHTIMCQIFSALESLAGTLSW